MNYINKLSSHKYRRMSTFDNQSENDSISCLVIEEIKVAEIFLFAFCGVIVLLNEMLCRVI